MDKTLRFVLASLPVLGVVALVGLARSLPGYFSNQQYLGGLLFLQALIVCLTFYDRFFFPFLMLAFLWAGMDLPLAEAWTQARWIVLGTGALIGFVRSMKLGKQRYNTFHLVASFCIAVAMVSAMVSALPMFSFLKVISLFLLFVYGASGARLVLGDRERFFRGLLLVCEINVYVTAIAYLVFHLEIWGNTNSLGAIEGVVAAPLLLWGAMVAPGRNLRLRRGFACVGALYLVYFSITRAAMLASVVSMLVLLMGIRRQRLVIQGVIGIACVVAVTALAVPQHFDDLTRSIKRDVIYKGHLEQGLLGSRLTPWQETTRVIQENPFFGSGFGTSMSGEKAFGESARFSSNSVTNREHGSSYLTITEWVGLLGIVPFVLLCVLVVRATLRVYLCMRKTGSAADFSVPIMMVLVAGFTHAFFEDWMFAVGYYLTVLFWVFAFLLMDLLPEAAAYRTRVVHGMRFHYPVEATAVRQ